MSNSQAAYSKYYVNSQQFEPINREAKLDKVREIGEDMIPTKTINKFNAKEILNKKNLKSFRGTFTFRNPQVIYEEIISDCRGSLPSNIQLMTKVNRFYLDKFEDNLRALYEFAPKFYRESFYQNIADTNGQKHMVIDKNSFALYEKYIYISCMIYYINTNKEKLRGELEANAEAIINWAQIRNNDALLFFIEGPKSNYANPPNFEEQYQMLVSSANSIEKLTTQNQLAKMDLTYNEISNFRHDAYTRPNSYYKEIDQARQYFVIVRDEGSLIAEIDKFNNLVFDAAYIDIGDITDKNTNGNYNNIIVEQNKYSNPPSQINYRAIQQLFNRYNAITIQELSFNYGVYKTDLSKYSLVYLVFPGINTIEHSIYGSLPRGTLMIAGKFVNNKSRRRYEFVTNEPLLTFDGSQTNVTSFQFYITTDYKEINSIEPNNLLIDFNKSDIYNHLLGTNRTSNDIQQNLQIKVPSTSIYFDMPAGILSVLESEIDSLISYINNFQFVPAYFRIWFSNFRVLYQRCINLKTIIIKRIVGTDINDITLGQARDANVETELTEYNQINNMFDSIAELLKKVNLLHKWQKATVTNANINELAKQLAELSTNATWKNNVTQSAVSVTDYQSVLRLMKLVCDFDINTVVDIQGTCGYEDVITYISTIDSAVSIISNAVSFDTVDTIIDIDIWKGTADGKLFHYETSKNQLHFVYSENLSDKDYHYLSFDENNIALIRFFDENCNIITDSSYIYDKEVSGANSEGIVQKSIMKIDSPMAVSSVSVYKTGTDIKIKRDIDDQNHYILTGGDVHFDMESSSIAQLNNNNCYANVTERLDSYQEADFWSSHTELRMKFIKYIDNKFIKFDIMNFDLFISEHDKEWSDDNNKYFDKYIIRVDHRRKLYLGIQRHIETDGEEITTKDEYYDLLAIYGTDFTLENMVVSLLGNKQNIKYDNETVNFEYNFYTTNGLVTKFEILQFNNAIYNYEDIGIYVDVYPEITTSTSLNFSDVATRYIKLPEMDFEQYLPAYSNDNLYRAYYSRSDLLSDFWLNKTYITSILINPITEEPKSKVFSGDINHLANSMCIIYTEDNHIKTFHNILVINKYYDQWLMLVDDAMVNESVYVYENEIREYVSYGTISVVDNEVAVTTLTDEDGRQIELTLYIDHVNKSIYKAEIVNPDTVKTLTINGNFNTSENYCFNSSALDPEFKALGTIGINFDFSDELINDGYTINITHIYLTMSTAHLYKYTIEGNRPYRYTLMNYFYNIYSTPMELSTNGLISIRNTNALNYNRIVPIFKYYQNNIESDLYANKKFKMVINKNEQLINNTLISLRRHKMITEMNRSNLNMANLVPYTDRYLIENINGKMVINNVENSKKNKEIVIEADSGVIDSTNNNSIYLSINLK